MEPLLGSAPPGISNRCCYRGLLHLMEIYIFSYMLTGEVEYAVNPPFGYHLWEPSSPGWPLLIKNQQKQRLVKVIKRCCLQLNAYLQLLIRIRGSANARSWSGLALKALCLRWWRPLVCTFLQVGGQRTKGNMFRGEGKDKSYGHIPQGLQIENSATPGWPLLDSSHYYWFYLTCFLQQAHRLGRSSGGGSSCLPCCGTWIGGWWSCSSHLWVVPTASGWWMLHQHQQI